MCGRFALGLSHEEIEGMHGYNVDIGEWVGREQFVPRYNIAPRTNAAVIRRVGGEEEGSRSWSAEEGTVILQTMRWGLVPHYSKHEEGTLKTMNARSERLIEGKGGMWGSIKGKQRCGVVCEGYYEWLKKGKERVAHFTKRKDGQVMVLGGLWDSVVLEGRKERLWTFTIVTRAASVDMNWLHDRQPLILADQSALHAWLDTRSGQWTPHLSHLCSTSPDLPLDCYQVPNQVGKVGTESATFVQPIAERKDGIEAMFARRPKRSLSPPPPRLSHVIHSSPRKPKPAAHPKITSFFSKK